jgi:hypothetical protein
MSTIVGCILIGLLLLVPKEEAKTNIPQTEEKT